MTQMRFDLALVEEQDRPLIEAATRRLHELERRTGEAIVEIGRTLIDVKGQLGHGQFGSWLDTEFGWTDRTARNFMQVAEVFGAKTEIISDFAPSALYALASGNVPESIREEFIQKAEAGEPIRHKDVKARLAEERQPAPAPVAMVMDNAIEVVTGEVVEEETFDDEPVAYEVLDGFPPPSPDQQHSTQMAPSPSYTPPMAPLTGGAARIAAKTADRHTDATIAERVSRVTGPVSQARAQLVELRKYPRYKEVVAENTELQEEMRACIREMNTLSSDLRSILGDVTTPTLRRVS